MPEGHYMRTRPEPRLSFSQRNGLAPLPPQLKLGEVSEELRRLIDLAIQREIGRNLVPATTFLFLKDPFRDVALDVWVKTWKRNFSAAPLEASKWQKHFETAILLGDLPMFYDTVERVLQHTESSQQVRVDLENALVHARAPYRIVDLEIMAIGASEQGEAVVQALSDTESTGAEGARRHLIDAGKKLKDGDWASSVRDSIHAVECVAKQMAPGAKTLGEALKVIDKGGHLHGNLKAAFEKLYAYTNAEDGIRHAQVFDGAEAKVDETDALFMLGACASFVSYLLARHRASS